jgi:hypothetical protein
VPSSGPFMGPWPTPGDESAVPNELVPDVAALVPKAPQLRTCAIPCRRPGNRGRGRKANAKGDANGKAFHAKINVTVGRRCA